MSVRWGLDALAEKRSAEAVVGAVKLSAYMYVFGLPSQHSTMHHPRGGAHLLGLVAAELVELGAAVTELIQSLEHLRLLRFHLLGNGGVGAVQLAVDVHGVVDHVGRPEEGQARGGDVAVRVRDEAGGNERIDVLEQREHHVQVEVGGNLRREVPRGGLGRVVGRAGFGHGDEFVRGVGAGHLPRGEDKCGLVGQYFVCYALE